MPSTRRRRAQRRRRFIVFGAAGALFLALAGWVTSAFLDLGGTATGTDAGTRMEPGVRTSPATDGGANRPVLSAHTLLILPAASAVATGAGAGFVTDDKRDVVERFDPATGAVEATTHLGGRPIAEVLAGGDVWVAEAVTNSVAEVSARSLQVVRSVLLPQPPTGLTVLGQTVWVASVTGKSITPIDDRTGEAGQPVGVLGGAVRVASGFGALWVTGTTHLLTRIVPTGNGNAPAQSPIEVGQGPIGVATGAGAVWVANAADGTVSKVDPVSLGVVTMTGVGADPFSVVVAGDRVFVSSGTQQTVRVVSPSPSHVLTLGTDPHNLVAVGAEVWVAASNPGEVVDVTAGHASP